MFLLIKVTSIALTSFSRSVKKQHYGVKKFRSDSYTGNCEHIHRDAKPSDFIVSLTILTPILR